MTTPKEMIEGKPLRSPWHPLLVHLPIALFPLSFLLDLASWAFVRPELQLVRTAFVAIAIGLGTALLAAIAGAVDYATIRNDHPAKKTATWHMILNLLAVALFALGLGLRYGSLAAERTDVLPLLISFVALGVLSYSGYLGGHLVYNDGIGVGRHRRRTRLPETTLAVSRPNKKDSAVSIEAISTLPEGGTARIDVDGTIVAVAKTGRRFCAVQEFCTHRYGPLSEGRIEKGQVICPWHRSRFDLATGQVVEGPAKVDLRTFPVENRAGKLWLHVDEASSGSPQSEKSHGKQ